MINASQGLALIRMGFGLYFLSQAFGEVSNGWLTSGASLGRQLQGSLQRGAEGFYRPFLEGVVLPNQDLFAQLVALGETVAGLSLLLGLLTRFGSVLGMFLVTNYMLMKGLSAGFGSIDRLFFLACLVFLFTSAGRVWGLDGVLTRRLGSGGPLRWLLGAPRPAVASSAAE